MAASATRVLAPHRLTIPEHALLSRLAAGASDCERAARGIALFSLQERGLVRSPLAIQQILDDIAAAAGARATALT